MASEIVTHNIFSESRKGIKLVLLWEDRKVISSSNISMFQLLFRDSEGSSVGLLVMISGGFCSSGHGQNSCAKINRCPVVLLDILIHLGCQLVVWKSHEDSPKSSYTSHNMGRKDAFAACSGSFGLLQPLGWAGTTCTLGSVPQLVLIQLPKYFQPQKHILFLDRSNYSSICWTEICFAVAVTHSSESQRTVPLSLVSLADTGKGSHQVLGSRRCPLLLGALPVTDSQALHHPASRGSSIYEHLP